MVNTSVQYLKLKEDHWHECLESSFGFLRASWPGNWLGMPFVLLECLRFLDIQKNSLSEAGKSMLDACLLYTSDAADEEDSVDLGGRRIIK